MARHECFQRGHEAPAHRAHQHSRRQRLAAMVPENRTTPSSLCNDGT
jgi:hypothetical protein